MEYPPVTWASWHADPSIVIGTILVCAAYTYAATRLQGTGLGPTRRQVWYFAGAVIAVVVALASPLHDLSEIYLFTAHMAQHVLLIMVMPPLLLASLTPAMLRPLIQNPRVLRFGRAVTRPVIAYGACNLVFAISHLPQFYELTL